MIEINDKQEIATGKKNFDLLDLIGKVWSARKFILTTCGIAFVFGLAVSISIPKEYTTSVTMTPESNSKGGAGNLGALANIAGISLASSGSGEALSPELYPDIVKSTPFVLDLFSVKVTNQKKDYSGTLYDYMTEHQRSPWWNNIFSAPFKAIGWTASLFSPKESNPDVDTLTAFQLSGKQTRILKSVSDRILVSVDNKNGMISLSVTMQDPLISAAITDTVMHNLQAYITNYRTNKAKHDLEYTERLYQEAQKNYYSAQQQYANFVDSNRDIILGGYRTRLERLQNEATLAYGLYNQISQQLQLAKAKVQEVTPIYTVIQPATVPLAASYPNKPMIIFTFVLIAFVCSYVWILILKDFFVIFRRKKKME